MNHSQKQLKQQIEFTPAIQKLFNRVMARVYHGNTRKKCSKEQLLSLQKQSIIKKYSSQINSFSYSQIKPDHMTRRKKQCITQRQIYLQNYKHYKHHTLLNKTLTYITQRKLTDEFKKPGRCKTESIKYSHDIQFDSNRESPTNLLQHSDILRHRDGKINQSKKMSSSLVEQPKVILKEPSKVYSQTVKRDKNGTSKLKYMEEKRRASNILRTKNKFAVDLGKNQLDHPYFKPWEIEQNDEMIF